MSVLAAVDDTCVVRLELRSGGAVRARARLGTVVVQDTIYTDDWRSDGQQRVLAKAEILDRLRVAVVARRLDAASDRDILTALAAAKRSGAGRDEVEVEFEAERRGLRSPG